MNGAWLLIRRPYYSSVRRSSLEEMPITKSAKKALRQSLRHRARNIKRFRAIEQAVKHIKKAAAAQRLDEARALLPAAYKAIDKAAQRKVIEKNTAARKKSRLAHLLAKR